MENSTQEEIKESNAPLPQTKTLRGLAQGIKDTATLEIRKPVRARVLNRIKEIEQLSRAHTITVPISEDQVEHITEAPAMFICKLSSYIRDGVGVITYCKYKTRKHPKTGELEKDYKSVTRPHLVTGRDYEHDRAYIIEKLVRETIDLGKPIKIEEYSYDA